MDFEDLRVFERLAQVLHFGQTARALAMSPSALTRRVQAVEQELGTALLLRETRRVRLTPAGERFRQFAKATLDQWEDLRAEMTNAAVSPQGELHVSCTVTACHTVLPHLLAMCRARYPRLKLRLITQDASRSLAALEAGEVDLAVIPTDDPGPAHLEVCVLARTDLIFIGPRAPKPSEPDTAATLAPLKPADWKNWFESSAIVAPLAGLERERLNSFLLEHGLNVALAAEVRGNEGIIAMVSLGGGIGLVPRLVLDASTADVQMLEGVPTPPGYAVSLCTKPRNLARDGVRVFWELARELAGQGLPTPLDPPGPAGRCVR